MTSFRSVRLIVLAAAGVAVLLGNVSIFAATPEEEAVLAPIQAMFDGMS